MYFNISTDNLKENNRNLEIPQTSYIFMLPVLSTIKLSDKRDLGLGIRSLKVQQVRHTFDVGLYYTVVNEQLRRKY